MILKNDALQELYDTLSHGPILSSPYAESPIDRAFKECDEKLSGSASFKVIKDIQNRCENLERSNKALRDDNDKLGDKIIELKKKNENLGLALIEKGTENTTLISANADLSDRINHLWTGQIQENMELRNKIANLQREKKNYETIAKERADLVKERDEARQDRDAWQRRAKYAEKELDLAKRNKDGWRSRAKQAEKRVRDLVNANDNLTKKVVAIQKENEELEKSRKCHRQLHAGEGARKLWEMLQNVNDSQPFEFDVECESMEDVIGMDLDDFLDAYKKWQKEKAKDIMKRREAAAHTILRTVSSSTMISAIRWQELMKRSRMPVELWSCTLEGTINVEFDRDLLEKVCGVKPNEEEHKLDYGDAVRVPWRDYDYMYIGPEGKHIRLFDPKTHTVVVVSVTDNLTYQGCKIILCDEDDIRKIWKDKK